MHLLVSDAKGAQQLVVAKGMEAPVDRSGSLSATGRAQCLMEANLNRSGFVFQNLSTVNPVWINDLGAASTGPGSFRVPPGGLFPPRDYPVSTGALSILGTQGDAYSAREW